MMMNGKHTAIIARDAPRPVPEPPPLEPEPDEAEAAIDFERVVFDPEYRARVRDALNRKERARRERSVTTG